MTVLPGLSIHLYPLDVSAFGLSFLQPKHARRCEQQGLTDPPKRWEMVEGEKGGEGGRAQSWNNK